MCAELAAQEPWWTPGTAHGYHAITYGWLVGELVRRVDGRSIGRFFREEIVHPLALDAFIGCGPELDARIAELTPSPPAPPGDRDLLAEMMADKESLRAKRLANPPALAARRGEQPRVARRGNLQRQRPHECAFARAFLRGGGCVHARRIVCRRATRVERRDGAHAHRTGRRCRQSAATVEPHRARLHAAESDAALFRQPESVRSRRRGWLARFLRSGKSRVVRLCDEPDAGRRSRRRPALVADDPGDVRRNRRALHAACAGRRRHDASAERATESGRWVFSR